MQTIKTSDWLISENKKGDNKYWRLHILADGDDFYTCTEWYQISSTGKETKKQLSAPYYCEPTNVGRANERDSQAQAYFEYDAIIKKQMDKGYLPKGEKKQERPMPMLAHKFKDHKGKVEFPVYVQPKLNGMRMLFDGEVGFSRGNKEIIPEVIQHLKFDTGGYMLDGELMLPNNVLLQESMSAIKKYRPGISNKLVYHVYDIVSPHKSFDSRCALLMYLSKNFPPNVNLVTTVGCKDESNVYAHHTKFVSDGYEGTMIRDPHMTYEIGKRSYSLLKLKDFVDAEYRIVDLVDGDGSDRGLAIFVLETNSGERFNCRPEGTQENRAELFRKKRELLGRFMTVRYFELSRDGIPIFPVGVSVRDWGEF
jgi:DNA ligase-1